jgi:hypothetical protein
MRALAQRLIAPYEQSAGPERTIGRATAICSIAAGLIHVSAAAEHDELPLMMVGFEVAAVLQAGLGPVDGA